MLKVHAATIDDRRRRDYAEKSDYSSTTSRDRRAKGREDVYARSTTPSYVQILSKTQRLLPHTAVFGKDAEKTLEHM